MKTITAFEAQLMIVEFIGMFQEIAAKKPQNSKFTATIENVSFLEFFQLYSRIKTPYKSLMMPGEFGTETMVMIYLPAPGCTIAIESEPCMKMWKGSIKNKNMN
jgi:hypothetical protein